MTLRCVECREAQYSASIARSTRVGRLDIEPISGGELIGAALLQDVLRKMLTHTLSKASEGLTHAITGAQSAEHTPLRRMVLTDTYATDTQSPTALTV